MTPWTDDRFDAALLDFLDWQAADRGSDPGAAEVARRIAHPRGRTSPATMRLGLALTITLIGLVVIGWALAVGGHPSPPLRLAVANGDISLPNGLLTFDSNTGASVAGPGCSNCGPGQARDAAWSPDGSVLAFVGPTGGLWMWRDGETAAQSVGGCPDSSCYVIGPSWSPDGQSILFIAGGPGLRVAGRPYVFDVATHAIREVPLPEPGMAVAWSRWTADDRITYVASTSGGHGSTVWTMALDGSGPEATADLPPDIIDLAISPTGDRIAYVDDPPTGVEPAGATVRLWVVDTRDGARRMLYVLPGCCLGTTLGGPGWSPDGTAVAFVGPNRSLMRFEAATGAQTILAHAEPGFGSPAWRPQVATP